MEIVAPPPAGWIDDGRRVGLRLRRRGVLVVVELTVDREGVAAAPHLGEDEDCGGADQRSHEADGVHGRSQVDPEERNIDWDGVQRGQGEEEDDQSECADRPKEYAGALLTDGRVLCRRFRSHPRQIRSARNPELLCERCADG